MLLRNFPFVGEVQLSVLARFRERAIHSFRTIGRLWDSKQSSGGVSLSSHAETLLTANGVPVTTFSTNFSLMKADTSNNSSVADAGRRPFTGEHQPRSGVVTSAVTDEEGTCAIQSDGGSVVAAVEVDNGWSSED